MGTVAGGASTAPLRTSNSAKWHGQTTAVFTSSPSASEQSSWVHVSSNAWKVPPTFATATGKLSISTLIIWPGWMLSAFATVTNRAMSCPFPWARCRRVGATIDNAGGGVLSSARGGVSRRCRGSAAGALPAPRRRRSRPSVLVVPARHLLARGEPHAALAAHVADEVLDQGHPRGAAADERVAREHEATVLTVHRDELLAPHLEYSARVGDRVGRAVDVTEERCVVHDPLDRDLGQRPLGGRDVVGHVVAHQRAVVAEPVGLEQARRPDVHVPRGRAVAGRSDAQVIGEDPQLLGQHGLFLRLLQRGDRLVDVAVGADLVPGVADALALRQVVLDRPPRNVEARPQAKPVEQSQDTVDADARPEPPLLQIGEAALGLLGLTEEKARLRVEVEREHSRGLLAIRPRVAHGSRLWANRSACQPPSASGR